jgi:hypothetical protein
MPELRPFVSRLFKARRAFTIIELLVAIGVTVVLVALMLNISVNVLNGWNRSSGKLRNENQARLVLDYLSQDLQGAILKYDTNTWLAATIQRDQSGTGDAGISGTVFTANWPASGVKPGASNGSFEINPGGAATPGERLLKNYRFGQAGVWLRFFTVPPDNSDPTDLASASAPRAVAYQMARVRVKGSDQHMYALFRSEVRPGGTGSGSTFSVGYDLFMSEGTSPSPGYNAGNAGKGNPGTVRQPHPDHIIGTDVIDFGVRLYGRENGAEVEIFPVRRDAAGNVLGGLAQVAGGPPLTYAASLRDPSNAPDVAGIGDALDILYGDDPTVSGHTPIYPTAAELLVRILTPEGARQIAALEAGQIIPPDDLSVNEYWWRIAEEHSDVFTRRVEIRSSGF